MTYDIDASGNVKNARASYCTENYLTQPSKDALLKWKYSKTKKDGSPVASTYLTTYMSFVIRDYDGVIITGKYGFMKTLPDGTYNKKKVCGIPIS